MSLQPRLRRQTGVFKAALGFVEWRQFGIRGVPSRPVAVSRDPAAAAFFSRSGFPIDAVAWRHASFVARTSLQPIAQTAP